MITISTFSTDFDEIDKYLASAMRLDFGPIGSSSSTPIRDYIAAEIKKLDDLGKHPRTKNNTPKAYGPRSLMQEIYGNWASVPKRLQDIIESNKTRRDPLGRAHNRLAVLISDIQRTSPPAQTIQKIPAVAHWADLLRRDLASNREHALVHLYRILSEESLFPRQEWPK